ncbi:F-actin-capping protein subunit alpha [Mrakia frigida]|uniref:Cap1p n=1 Tax=Mrakia frigida TaxID=29902 RepID=UPI003FCBF8C7
MSDQEELSTEERIQVVSKYILQAPPGEINDVVNDVRLLLDDDALFQSLLPSALKEYHSSQFTAVDVPGQSYQTLIAPAAFLPVDPPKYFEPRSSQTFEFDPVKLVASSFEPLTTIPESTSSFLSTIQPILQTYITNHFTTGTGSVFPTFVPGPPPPPPLAPAAAPEEEVAEVAVVPIASQEEDPIIETALVETADEVVEVAKEVEEELKIETEQEQEEREQEKKTVEDGTWEEEDVGEGGSMKGVEEPVAVAASPAPVEHEMAAPKEEEEIVAAPEKEESKEMEVETPVKEEEPVAAAVEPEVVEEVLPAGVNVEVVDGKYTVVTSGYRYSPANFWTGRWRSSYSIDLSQSSFTGTIEVVVHYYEQGNVQLRTTQTPTLTLPSSNASPKDIVAAIGQAERAAQEGINARLEELADKAFKSLRRALPVTRQKMEWEKVGGYKLGGAIGGKGRGEVEAQV